MRSEHKRRRKRERERLTVYLLFILYKLGNVQKGISLYTSAHQCVQIYIHPISGMCTMLSFDVFFFTYNYFHFLESASHWHIERNACLRLQDSHAWEIFLKYLLIIEIICTEY